MVEPWLNLNHGIFGSEKRRRGGGGGNEKEEDHMTTVD